MIETRLLRQFLVLAEELHFGRAAMRLHMAQPPLSQAMLRLEEKVGVALIHRSTRRVSLTAAGEAFRRSATEIVEAIAAAVFDARRVAAANRVLTVSGLQFRGYDFLLAAIRDFSGPPEGPRFHLRQGATGEQVEWLHARSTDLAFLRGVESLCPPFVHECIARERLYAVLHARHPLARQDALGFERLAGEGFVFCARGLGAAFHDHLLDLCRRSGFEPRIEHEVTHMQTLLGLVEARMGVSLVPASVVSHSDGVRFVPMSDVSTEAPAQVDLNMAWAADAEDALRDAFIEVVRRRRPAEAIRIAKVQAQKLC